MQMDRNEITMKEVANDGKTVFLYYEFYPYRTASFVFVFFVIFRSRNAPMS